MLRETTGAIRKVEEMITCYPLAAEQATLEHSVFT